MIKYKCKKGWKDVLTEGSWYKILSYNCGYRIMAPEWWPYNYGTVGVYDYEMNEYFILPYLPNNIIVL
jgi:hypothetical protein